MSTAWKQVDLTSYIPRIDRSQRSAFLFHVLSISREMRIPENWSSCSQGAFAQHRGGLNLVNPIPTANCQPVGQFSNNLCIAEMQFWNLTLLHLPAPWRWQISYPGPVGCNRYRLGSHIMVQLRWRVVCQPLSATANAISLSARFRVLQTVSSRL